MLRFRCLGIHTTYHRAHCVKTTSPTKPEVHNISQRCRRAIEPRLQATCTENLLKFGRYVVSRYASGQSNTIFHTPFGGRDKKQQERTHDLNWRYCSRSRIDRATTPTCAGLSRRSWTRSRTASLAALARSRWRESKNVLLRPSVNTQP